MNLHKNSPVTNFFRCNCNRFRLLYGIQKYKLSEHEIEQYMCFGKMRSNSQTSFSRYSKTLIRSTFRTSCTTIRHSFVLLIFLLFFLPIPLNFQFSLRSSRKYNPLPRLAPPNIVDATVPYSTYEWNPHD